MGHKKCFLCGKRIHIRYGHNAVKYCLRCARFVRRLQVKGYPPKTVKSILDYVRKNGFVCYYTRMLLDMGSRRNPWHCVFDHWIPHDNRKVVITSAFVNTLKSDLMEKEFWCLIRRLARCWRKHIKMRKMRLRCWNRNNKPLGVVDEVMQRRPRRRRGRCLVCGKRFLYCSNNTKYCHICSRYVNHMEQMGLPRQTIKDVCAYIRKYGYRCYYTGMLLELNDPLSPWYCVLDHWVPGDPGKIVLTSAVLNTMKSDLTEKEFRYYICALADYKEKGKKVRKKKLVHWFRLSCPPKRGGRGYSCVSISTEPGSK